MTQAGQGRRRLGRLRRSSPRVARRLRPLLVLLLGGAAPAAPGAPERVEVTATRLPASADRVAADLSIVSGDEVQARRATDLGGALALVPGVEAPPGGDAGPAGAVPSIWGLHEFDAFLLVVDGVPWGGAFNPAIPTLDLTGVQRIEVLKGAAPVLFGATAFVGVIQVIHAPAGAAADRASVGVGTHGSARGQASVNLPALGGLVQSLDLDGGSLGYRDRRAGIANGHALYRARTDLGAGSLRIDLDAAILRQAPPSPVVRTNSQLTSLTPLDANANPADAGIDENRFAATLGYRLPTGLGAWDSTVSLARSDITDIRGFLRPSLAGDGSLNADSQNQRRHRLDLYVDSQLARPRWRGVDLLLGADLLYGAARQSSVNGAYLAALDGSRIPPPTSSLPVDEINAISDHRLFAGQYLQATVTLSPAIEVDAGLRLNETDERLASRHLDGADPTADQSADQQRSVIRPSETIAISAAPIASAREAMVLYADIRQSFKPAAIDFGPDYTPDILLPEQALSYEAGVKGQLAGGELGYGLELFRLDFSNLVVTTTAADGAPLQQNAGGQRLRGIEGTLTWQPAAAWTLRLNASLHEARFTRYVAAEGGAEVNASGRMLPLSPPGLLSAGLLYAPTHGPGFTLVARRTGRRFLDIANTAPVQAYTTLDATISYRFARTDVSLAASNLTDARPPVTASEFGDQSVYRLPGRQIFLDAGVLF